MELGNKWEYMSINGSKQNNYCKHGVYSLSSTDEEDEATNRVEMTSSGDSRSSSFLESLKSPMPSEQGRKQKTKVNPLHNKCASRSLSEPKSISPAQRAKEYPAEPFNVSSGKLFCYGCREEVNLKSTVINNRIRSKKHQIGKAKLEVRVEKGMHYLPTMKKSICEAKRFLKLFRCTEWK